MVAQLVKKLNIFYGTQVVTLGQRRKKPITETTNADVNPLKSKLVVIIFKHPVPTSNEKDVCLLQILVFQCSLGK
jgi:hypothetical protein